ncbi:hypothetical protein ACLB2K_041358 [Fragaria x ananassa]
MAAFVPPPGAPRPNNNSNTPPPPPPNYNAQRSPDSLSENMHNLNLNRQQQLPNMPNYAPRPSLFGQPPPFPGASAPYSRPGPPPARPVAPPQATLPPGTTGVRPTGPPAGQSPLFGSRPPPGSFPPGVAPTSWPASSPFQTTGLPSGPVATPPAPSSGPRPGPGLFASGQAVPSMGAPGRMSNGPPAFGSGAVPGAPRFPPTGNLPQPSVGPQPPMSGAPHTPTMHSVLGGPAVSAPPGSTAQQAPPFSSGPQGMRPPPPGSPYSQQSWPMQQGQVAPPTQFPGAAPPPQFPGSSPPPQFPGSSPHPQFPGSAQPPRMYGMPPQPLPNQSMTTISSAASQTGTPVGSSKIDPNQIPRPGPSSSVLLHETRQANQANPPPPATSDYIVRDNGNCSPRYMRCTINQIPCTADLLTTSGMPLALLVEPFALPHPSEEPIQVVDFGESGPVRCSRCKGYINPFMKFIDQGRQFICNLCGFSDETPRDYHCNLGPDGRRRDADDRPELCRGTVEFVASKEYMVRDPMPAVYFFLIDVSMNAVQTGATAAACSAINQVIADLPEGPRTMEPTKLLQPVDKTLKTMAIEFAEYQVCVDLFITTQSYIDIASISVIPRTTGGQVYYYYPFSAVSDPAKLYNDLRWNVTRPQGFEAVMRVRCSQGIQVQEYFGNFCKRIPTDVDLPGIDCDKTIMVMLKHDDKLQDGSECSFQCAVLYTTVYGQRRIRVTTLSLPCTSMLSNLFRSADLDTQFSCYMKQAANEITSSPLVRVREQTTNLCISSLFSYRKYCATVSSSGQLILPEALKLLPLYTLALIKSTGLRTDGKIDERSVWINHVSSLSVPLAVPLVYPRMVAVHDLDAKKEGDESLIPPVIPLASEHVSDDGIYLLENGEDCLIYVGNLVDSGILQQLFGVGTADELPTQFVLQQYDNSLSKKLNNVVNEIRRQRCSYLRLKLCKKGDPSGAFFLSHLVEDQSPHGPSYVEFLKLHHLVDELLDLDLTDDVNEDSSRNHNLRRYYLASSSPPKLK